MPEMEAHDAAVTSAASQSIVQLPAAREYRQAYYRVLGRYILATEQIWTLGQAVSYVTQVGLEVSERRTIREPLRRLVMSHLDAHRTRTSGYWTWNDRPQDEHGSGMLRIRYPNIAIKNFQARADLIRAAWASDIDFRFRDFAWIAMLVCDEACAADHTLMARVITIWRPARFGLESQDDRN